MNDLKKMLFEHCKAASTAAAKFTPGRVVSPNEPQTEEEAQQYFRGLYKLILSAGLDAEYEEWKEKERNHVGEKVP